MSTSRSRAELRERLGRLTLETDRLVLRGFIADDVAAVHEYASDPEVTRFTTWGPNSLDETRAFVAHVVNDPDPGLTLAITLRGSGRLIGAASVYVESDEHRRGYLGYMVSRAYWSWVFATEATRRLVRSGSTSWTCIASRPPAIRAIAPRRACWRRAEHALGPRADQDQARELVGSWAEPTPSSARLGS